MVQTPGLVVVGGYKKARERYRSSRKMGLFYSHKERRKRRKRKNGWGLFSSSLEKNGNFK